MRSGQSSNVLERRASDGTGTPDSHAATFTHDFECLITCGWCKTQPFTDTGLDDAPNNNGAPIVGKCGHTVCLDCLIVAAYYQDELFRKSKLQCPKCSIADSFDMNNLVVNHAVRDMIKYLTLKEEERDRREEASHSRVQETIRVAKYFEDGEDIKLYFGEAYVDLYDTRKKKVNFLVQYDDGDSEHMTEDELKRGIRRYKRHVDQQS